MEKTLYDLMDWAGIEEIVYSEAPNPRKMLGAHRVKEGLLIQAFVPDAVRMEAVLKKSGRHAEMDQADEAGFYACLFPDQEEEGYLLRVTDRDGRVAETEDAYAFAPGVSEDDLKKFAAGTDYRIYEKMGAHPATADGVPGVRFAVWAPDAMRVSVVGDFNAWDGRRYQMEKCGDSGVFALFIPRVPEGALYKFEIKTRHGEPMLKDDPYANLTELRPNTACIVTDLNGYQWHDADWLKKRPENQDNGKTGNGKPLSVYEVHLGSWMTKPAETDSEGREKNGSRFVNYREIADRLAAYAKEMHYTHVELMPVMEHAQDASWGYQVSAYYAPTSRFGTPQDFMYLVDTLHGAGIGVILDWVPAGFPRDCFGLGTFDGSHVYEPADPRRSEHPQEGTYIFDYGKPQVADFLIANALFWLGTFHADGLRMVSIASMLYLDYEKNEGEWLPNIYGGHENLEAVEFLRRLNTVCREAHPDALLIAEENSAWPKITASERDEGLGFDYKWNSGWTEGFLKYMSYDPLFRGAHYGELTFSLLYQYSENFILALSHEEVRAGRLSLVNKMPGATFEDKFANLRAAYGFMMVHPGKKLLFMGQEFAQMDEWNENNDVEWKLLQYPIHKEMQDYVKALNGFYLEHPALWQLDDDPAGFEWINCHSWKENVLAFLRKSGDGKETLLVVCNFTPIYYPKFNIGVPFDGVYKEIFNSDHKTFGGTGAGNRNVKRPKKMDVDDREEGISITLPPMCVMVFSCTEEDPEAEKKAAAGKTAAGKMPAAKAAGKTPAVKKPAAKARQERNGKNPAAKKGQKTERKAKTAEKPAFKSAGKAAPKGKART